MSKNNTKHTAEQIQIQLTDLYILQKKLYVKNTQTGKEYFSAYALIEVEKSEFFFK